MILEFHSDGDFLYSRFDIQAIDKYPHICSKTLYLWGCLIITKNGIQFCSDISS